MRQDWKLEKEMEDAGLEFGRVLFMEMLLQEEEVLSKRSITETLILSLSGDNDYGRVLFILWANFLLGLLN